MNDSQQAPPKYSVDQTIMLAALKVVAQAIVTGQVTGIALAVITPNERIVGHHLTELGDPDRLRGLLAEVSDQVRETYVKPRQDGAPRLFAPDGSTVQ